MNSSSRAKAGCTRVRMRSTAAFARRSRSAGGDARGHAAKRTVVAALLARLLSRAARPARARARTMIFGSRTFAFMPFAHQRDVLIHVGGERVEPREPVVEVLDGLKAQRVDDELRVLHAVERRGADQMLAVLKALDRHLVLMPEQVVVQPIGGRELVARNRRELFQHRLAMRLPRGKRLRADVRPPVVPAAVAEIGRPQRILSELPLPFAIEQCVQRGARCQSSGV